MLQLAIITVSYAAMLILLMPPTFEAIISTVVTFFLGFCFLLYKKVHTKLLWKCKHYYLIPASFYITAKWGIDFYNTWFYSSKMHVIASMIRIPADILVLGASVMLSILSVYIVYYVLQKIINILFDENVENDSEKTATYFLLSAALTVLLSQIMIDLPMLSMGFSNFIWSILSIGTVILFVFILFGKVMPAISIGSAIFMVLSTINVYVYRFRGRLLEPVDIFSVGTAINVAGNYSLFPIPSKLLICWFIWAAMLAIIYFKQQKKKTYLTVKKRFALLTVCIFSFIVVFFYTSHLKTYHWGKEGASFNGYILDFISKYKEISPAKPDNYSSELIVKLTDQYSTNDAILNSDISSTPHIIVIMNEAFSDLSAIGDFSTNTEVMPYISSLKENTISGSTLVSVYGGNTANSEYEFLTGNSLAWLSPNVVPYQQYVRMPIYSMISYLKSSLHYKCLAMHPFDSSGWNRPNAYKHLGFDQCYFIEDFPKKNYVRQYISDQEMFEFLIQTFETQKSDQLFIFGITMQNHGNYIYTGENYSQSVFLSDYPGKFPDVEQYLSLIHETDQAVEHLITYFQNVTEDVIIVFYGDHQPKIADAFYETITKTTTYSLDEQQKRYEIPFFIWANYDIEEKYIDRTSLNYLSSYVYDAAGIPLPPYNRFLKDMEAAIPAINANGFYSPAAGCYLSFEEANGEEKQWLETYEALQYNNIFDKKNRNDILFPVLK